MFYTILPSFSFFFIFFGAFMTSVIIRFASRQRFFGTALACSALVVLMVSGCRPATDPATKDKELEEVLPNVVRLNLASANPAETVSATWRSTSTAKNTVTPVQIDTLRLTAGRTYTGTITAINDLKTPNVNLNEDYLKHAEEHQFFYIASVGAPNRVTFTITDRDKNNLPLGLTFNVAVSTGASVRGTLNVVLGHYDDVKKDGTTRSPETDIDITFPVVIR